MRLRTLIAIVVTMCALPVLAGELPLAPAPRKADEVKRYPLRNAAAADAATALAGHFENKKLSARVTFDALTNTVFVSGDNVTRGWKTVLERYKKNYDTPEKMGKLTFSDLEMNMLSKDTAVVIGKWLLKRSNDEPHGRFTLIFKKTGHGWRIIHDHTSSA